MRAVTTAFSDAILASHQLATRITVLKDDDAILDIDSAIDGSVTLDITAATRGRCDLTIIDDGTLGLIPTTAADPLAPYGNEIKIERGIQYEDGSTELVSLGIYRIDSTTIEDGAGGLQIKIGGTDRSSRIIDARFEEPYQVAAGTNYATAIENVIAAATPSITFDLTATTITTPSLIANEGDDRWKFAQDMAQSLGHILYFDGDGICVSRPIASLGASAPSVQLVEGESGLLLSASRAWGRTGTYNRVIATGENTGNGTPVRGVATDTNPLSATYYYGPFGKVPRFYASPLMTTDAQAADAAAGILARELGTTQQVGFGSIVNPAIEPNDIARITRARAGIDEDHIIDQITIPLSAEGTMSGRTRAVATT